MCYQSHTTNNEHNIKGKCPVDISRKYMQIMTNSYRYFYQSPSCKELDTLSMILNGFESIFF